MLTIPFHDFDEAHRAENAKRMKEYLSFLVPLTGSSQDRNLDLRVPLRENPQHLFLYYHPERPPFVYWMMIATTSIFGTGEWAYRLPSFLTGALTIAVFVFFIIKYAKTISVHAFFIGLLSLITSADLWLSSQYAQLDTSLTFFLFLSLVTLLVYMQKRELTLLIVSGLSFALAILSKGQPAAIFIFPLLFLILAKKLTVKEFIRFCLWVLVILLPWFILLEVYFGFARVAEIFWKFAASSSMTEFSHIKAPVFWYLRWWWDSFRPGWTLFLALFIFDLLRKSFSWERQVLLSYIFGGFILFSLSVNKIWWYVLPLIPAISYYIYLSAGDYLKKNKSGLVNLSAIIFLASLPILITASNKVTILYGFAVTSLSLIFLRLNLSILSKFREALIVISILFSLLALYRHFPAVVPFHYNTKPVALYFASLPGEKCLWVKDMPAETAIFYSNAGETPLLEQDSALIPNCTNYLITPLNIRDVPITYTFRGKVYNLADQEILYQTGTMKLIRLHPKSNQEVEEAKPY